MPDSFTMLLAHFLFRWTLANILGWSLGFFLGGLLLNALGGIIGVVLGGSIVGALVGLVQWFVLRHEADWVDSRWAIFSAVGGGLGTIPAYVAGVTLIAGPVMGYFVIGAVYGGIFGTLQWLILRAQYTDLAWLWIVTATAGGGLCGCLTMTVNPLRLPVFCSFGPVAFGLITGYTLLYLNREIAEDAPL
jgi:hypothetical protein